MPAKSMRITVDQLFEQYVHDLNGAWDDWAKESPENVQIKRLALALCVVNGFSPMRISVGPTMAVGPKEGKELHSLMAPNWAAFILDAETALAEISEKEVSNAP